LEANKDCQCRGSFRLGHSIQSKDINKPWIRRNIRPLIPKDKEEASKVVSWILQIAGLPPLKFTLKLFERKKEADD
jgi:hypothetical protein